VTSPGTLVIRADASPQIGWGHAMRCLALAQAWQDRGGRAVFAMAETFELLQARLLAEGIPTSFISAAPASAEDARQLSSIARKCKASWIVLDGYHFKYDYQRALESTGQKLLAIDDYGLSGVAAADVVLDQNPGVDESVYAGRKTGRTLLLGSRYAMLRREFKAWRNWKREVPSVAKRIVVTMGGSDSEDITNLVLYAILQIKAVGFEVRVVSSGAGSGSEFKALAGASEHDIHAESAVPNMQDLMAWADLAIIAGGGTLWELLYMMCPVASFSRNAEQAKILAHPRLRGTLEYLGPAESMDSSVLRERVFWLATATGTRRGFAARGREIVDGLGADRVCELMSDENRIGSQSEVSASIGA
jgi:UDP-2,4-diacetamido-2,4,6-trideoxy-beta-L-altropyranose hydrolase